MKTYKIKGKKFEFRTDLPIKHIKKSLESSERWEAKKYIKKVLQEILKDEKK